MNNTTFRQSPSMFRSAVVILTAAFFGFGDVHSATAQAQKPTADFLLKTYKPTQKDVEFDTPDAAETAKCNVDLEKGSYVVTNPAGQVLRRFTDSNADGAPDMFRYYHMGLEVYREMDTNGDARAKKNQKADQYRWMNWGGTRWGMDEDEDGRIESWKVLSAQEAARIAVESLMSGDAARLNTVLLTDEDLRALQLPSRIPTSPNPPLLAGGCAASNPLPSSSTVS